MFPIVFVKNFYPLNILNCVYMLCLGIICTCITSINSVLELWRALLLDNFD
jgi:hypothetical protein